MLPARFIIPFVFAALFTISAQAQNYYEAERRSFYGALIAGANFAQIDGDNYAGYNKAGFQAGGAAYIFLHENIAANMEILFSQRGSSGHPKESGVRGINIERYRADLNYAEVPVQLFYIDKHWNHFGGGISYSRLVSSKETVESFPAYDFNEEQFPFKKSDVSLLLGGSVCVWKGLFVNLRFQYSLLPIRKPSPPGLGRQEQYNNSISFRVLYLFGK